MRLLAMLVPLALIMLAGLPAEVAAQCETPESCYNVGEDQFCGGPGGDSWDYEDCHVSGGFCQLSGRCDSQTFRGGMTSPRYAQLPADRTVTLAGTYAPVHMHAFDRPRTSLKTCTGFVITAATSVRPSTIVLD